MAITLNPGRQTVILAYVDISYDDLVSGVAATAINLPANAVVVAGAVTVTAAWDSSISDVLDVGDAGSANRYVNDINLQSAARSALVPTGYKGTTPVPIKVTWTGAGYAPSQGSARLEVQYYVDGRAFFSEG